jgi:DNA/RNA endonuclease YhcR with UshA esterase domain
MILHHWFVMTVVLVARSIAFADDKPLTPVEARGKVGEQITVEMTVRASKDRLQKRGEIYLDSEADFHDAKNFAVVITKSGAASLQKAGIANPAAHFKGKVIRASGRVKEVDEIPRIEIDDAKQIRVVAQP